MILREDEVQIQPPSYTKGLQERKNRGEMTEKPPHDRGWDPPSPPTCHSRKIRSLPYPKPSGDAREGSADTEVSAVDRLARRGGGG